MSGERHIPQPSTAQKSKQTDKTNQLEIYEYYPLSKTAQKNKLAQLDKQKQITTINKTSDQYQSKTAKKEPYKKQMVELGIDPNRYHLYGPISDVKKEYLSSSVFVLPSRFEGFGLVIIEAMACGVPVVAFDCENGPRSIIADGETGFLIPPFDINAFAEKVMLLISDIELRKQVGMNAQEAACQYDIDRIGKQWKHLFEEMKQQ